MPVFPAWALIILALLSAHVVRRRQGIGASVPRFYIGFMYAVIALELLGPPAENNATYVFLNRLGFVVLFLADILPAVVDRLRKKTR